MLNQLRKIAIILFISLFSVSIYADNYAKREVRSAWVATVWALDWPQTTGTSAAQQAAQKNELITMLNNLKNNGFNAVYFQVRSMCDAMYRSSYEPWSSYLTGNRGADPGWDPLEFAVEECHKRGMECHAWVNPYRFSTGTNWTTAQDTELKNSGMLLTYTTTTVLNPGLEIARQRIVNVCKEIATNYDIDGIIFDDYFYPSKIPATSAAADYNLWKDSGTSLSFADWRRANVNLMVKNVYDMIQSIKPYLKFGISPAGVAGTKSTSASKYGVNPCPTGSDWQYNDIFSDPLAWIVEGTIDYISPQLYWETTHSSNPFGPLTEWWSYVANKFGRHHYASHSISSFASNNTSANWAEVSKQVQLSRDYTENKAPGCVFYSASYISGPKKSGFGNYLKANKFQHVAITPAIDWKPKTNYSKVSELAKTGSTISWKAVNGNGIKYSIYAIPTAVMPDEAKSTDYTGYKSDYLVDLSYSNSFALPTEYQSGFWYAVCIIDGYSNEFEAATINAPGTPAEIVTLTAPINNAIVDSNPAFSWSSATNATYSVQISTSDLFSTIALEQKNISTNSATIDLNELNTSVIYYWRVITSQPGKTNSTSATETFTIKEREKAPVTSLVSPETDATINGSIDFLCTNVAIDTYTLQVSATTSFTNIIYSTTDFKSNGENMATTIPANRLFNGKYYWKVTTSKRGMIDNVSEVRNFTVEGNIEDPDEPGYERKYDVNTYGITDKIGLTSLWIRSVKDPYNNIAFAENGLLNRGICVSGNIIYISGRSDNSATASCYLEKYNATTGAYIGRLNLSSDVSVSYYPCNDVFKDSEGNICVSNLTLNVSTVPLKIFLIDPVTGNATLKAECKNSSTASRIDHCAIYGNVKSGNFSVFAAIASDNKVIKWTYATNILQSTNICTLKALYPSNAGSLGIAPRIIPVSETSFYAIGANTALTRYNFSTGAVEGSFSSNTDLAPEGLYCNGGTFFAYDTKNYIVYPYSDHTNSDGLRFNIVSTDANYDFASMSKLWTIPQAGIGDINSTTGSALVDYKHITENGKTATYIYVYVPGNGLAAYSLYKDGQTSIEGPESQIFKMSIVNKTISFNATADIVEIYGISGNLIIAKNNSNELDINYPSGVYIVKAKSKDEMIVKKIFLK